MFDPRIKKDNTEHLRAFAQIKNTMNPEPYQLRMIDNYYRCVWERTEFENRRLGRSILTER